MARVKKVKKLIYKIKKITDGKVNNSKSKYSKTSINELEQNKIYLLTYMLKGEKNSALHNLGQHQAFNPVVRIKKCKVIEQLISDYQSGHASNVQQNIDESNKANEVVSNLTTYSISNINSNMKSTNLNRNKISNIDKPKFIQSLKVTTQVDTKTRKIDVISVPIETVSIKNREIKLMNRKLWNISNLEINGLGEIFKISSSDTIFKDASLEFDALSAGRTSSKVSLSQRISTRNSPTFSIVNKWSSHKSVDSASKLASNQLIGQDKYKDFSNIEVQVCDCPTQGSVHVRSESSGYHSEQKLSDNSPVSSTVSSPKRKISADYSDAFTLSSKSILTKFSTVTVQNNLTPASVNKRKYDFKVPRLPVIKRPPTRIKRSDVKQSTSGIGTNNPVPRISMDDSDAISLYAESVYLGLEEKVKHNSINNTTINNILIAPGFSNPDIKQHNDDVLQSSNNSTSCTDKIKEKLKHSKALLTSSTSVEIDTSKVNDWIVSTTKNHVNNSNSINVLKKLCHIHFRNGKCLRERCWFSHKLPYDFENTLRELTEQQFQLALGEIVKYRYLFKETFDTILLYFKENNQIDGLIYLINDILKLDFDKTPFIKKVIHTLKDMGYSFVEAIDEILLTHGRKTQSLQDILLMLIVEEDDCLENNWHFINKITKFRKNKLDYGVVCEIFQKCCNTDNPKKEFCENIYKDLIIKSHIELDKIERHLVIKYIYLLYHFNLVEYAEQLKQNNNIKDQEIISNNFKETIFEDTSNPNIVLNSESCSSSCSESSSTNSTTTEGNVRHEDESVLEEEHVTKQNFAHEKEKIPIFFNDSIHTASISNSIEENEVKVGGEKNSSMNQNYQLFQSDSPLQYNCSYSNSDLETYFTYVNRDTYLPNYYSSKEMLSSNKSCSNSVRLDCSSPKSGHFSFSSPPQGTTPLFLSSTNTENEILHYAELVESENITEAELSDVDIMKLVAGINQKDLSAIFSIMKKCADNDTPRSCVIHIVTALKKMPSIAAHDIIMNIFENLEGLMPHLVNQSSSMKNLIKLLAFNILPMLDKGKEYGVATRVINIFGKEMDSFIETQCIQNFGWLCTTKLRYIFIFKIFVRDRKLKEALKLLKSCNLNLFQSPSAEMELIHNDYKKRILNEFVDIALQRDLQVARETILYLMLNMDSVENFIDLMKFLNQLLVKLLNSYSSFKPELLGLIDNITNGWFKYLKPSIMRAILIQAFHDLSERRLMEFFNLCVDIGIYRIHKGFDNSIGIPKNLLPEEVQLILHIHFYKICKSNFPLHNIVISVESQIDVDEYAHQINVFTPTLLDNKDIITRILNVCAKFERFPNQEKMSVSSELITIPYEYLKYFFIPYRTSLPPLTRFR